MSLIDQVKAVCTRLAPKGWGKLLAAHGLDIGKADLAAELGRPLGTINHQVPGFEDFAAEGTRGIEPGSPAQSLLYHALASPNVMVDPAGKPLRAFATLAEIEAVENYVFGAQPPSLNQLRALAGGNVAIVVFAVEYRPAPETTHRRHADLCFSRTGIARVGTAPAAYDGARRGFLPFVPDDAFAIRALPARYAVYLAAQWKGRSSHVDVMNATDQDDDQDFWVPLQKLFSGPECLGGLDLQVKFAAHHRNEKLRRIHLAWRGQAGWTEPDISAKPFMFSDGIAELSAFAHDGSGLVIPQPHPLVEVASYQGKPLTFQVPPSPNTLSSSVYIDPEGDGRSAPEFVHARHLVKNGKIHSLNDEPNVAERVAQGGYQAQHYVDYTGDGWVEATCPQLGRDVPRTIAAYSVVAAPDFFINCDQREMLEWSQQAVPKALRLSMWNVPPETLSDQRLPPNLTLGDRFVKEDKTATAIVALARFGPLPKATRSDVPASMRHAHLPDAAAGIFDPGWDVSRDTTQGTAHLAAYGLGSPFPEDAKLCAALSTFWPAVAPDAGRTFQPNPTRLGITPTVAPLTDEEIGRGGGQAWDGQSAPAVVNVNGVEMVEYAEFDHADYVEMALAGKFSLALTGKVDTREYQSRVLAMARAYRALGIRGGGAQGQLNKKARWAVLSASKVEQSSPEVKAAEAATRHSLDLPAYRLELYQHGSPQDHPKDVRKIRVPVGLRAVLLIDAQKVLFKKGSLAWQQSHG